MSDGIHSCSYYCVRPACVLAQRDEMRERLFNRLPSAEPSAPAAKLTQIGWINPQVARAANCGSGSTVVRIRASRLRDDVPVMVRADILPGEPSGRSEPPK